MSNNWPLRYDLLLRYRVIEIIVYWEGRLTTNHLCKTFGIGRQQASKDINEYISLAKDNISYAHSVKGFVPNENFKPRFTTGSADEYLYLINRNRKMSSVFDSLDLNYANTEVLDIPVRDIKPELLRPLVQAARNKKRIEVDYISLTSPALETRVITPHTLVHTGMRWHVRAYCEKRKEFTDFVLSRFRGIPDIMDNSPHHSDMDIGWNTWVNIRITPDSRLSKTQQAIIANDYGMVKSQFIIKTRGCLVPYALRLLQLDAVKIESKPEAQQIIIANIDELKQWLF